MLEVIVYVVPTILISLVGIYLYVETKRRKAIDAKKRAIISRVTGVKDNFKGELKGLVEQNILTIKQHEAIYRLANNFFIFQPVSSQSIEFCEYSLNNVISVIPKTTAENINYDRIQELINVFVRALPVLPNGYNANFYRKDLPLLIKQLVNAIEELYKIDSELNNLIDTENEEVLTPCTSEAA
ncbi:MAG: hypothetical protein GY951_07080 [Psychromonas sp.]|nr:hypothetical protein [Alteromonadales bacterium]MCP5077806.1 hypothetical protein [Psychromonas sp.]